MMIKTTITLGFAMSVVACSGGEPCDPNAPGTICTIAGNGDRGFTDDGVLALEARLDVPQDISISPDGVIWFLDFNNYQIRTIDETGALRTLVGSGLLGDSPTPEEVAVGILQTPAATAYFNHTTDMIFHQGYLYLAAWHNSRVKRVNLDTMMLENYAGAGVRTLYIGDDGPAMKATLDLPSSVTLDPEGNIVIMDQANQVIRRVNQDGTMSRIAGQCVVDVDAPCAASEQPVQCPDSNKFVCGGFENCSKPCTPGYGGDGGSCMQARMAQPFGQAADPSGRVVYDRDNNLIFADTGNNRIRRVTPAGIIETLAGTGAEGYGGDGGLAKDAVLNHPVDVEVADDNTIYFTDVYNSCVRKIDTSGKISRVAGQCNSDPKSYDFGGDGGDPLDAKLDRPYGIELHGNKLYIADSYNHRIRVVNL